MSDDNKRLTSKEYEIMKILWDSEKPLLISDIHMKADKIADNSLHPMINKLIQKGFIEVTGSVRVVKTVSRLYAPAVNLDEYAAMRLGEILRTSGGKLNIYNVLNKFLKRHQKNGKITSDLENFINNYKSEQNY